MTSRVLRGRAAAVALAAACCRRRSSRAGCCRRLGRLGEHELERVDERDVQALVPAAASPASRAAGRSLGRAPRRSLHVQQLAQVVRVPAVQPVLERH